MRFWDASAIVPLLIAQSSTSLATRLRRDDPAIAVWWGTTVECSSAIARLLRQGDIDRSVAASGIERLRELEAEWDEVEPSVAIRDEACRLLRAHPLRAADALQLAAALRLAAEVADRLGILCFDARLADAARAENLNVVRPEREAG